MSPLSRRDFLGATTGLAALPLGGSLADAAPAKAAWPVIRPTFYRWSHRPTNLVHLAALLQVEGPPGCVDGIEVTVNGRVVPAEHVTIIYSPASGPVEPVSKPRLFATTIDPGTNGVATDVKWVAE